jgi:hypothetical protein
LAFEQKIKERSLADHKRELEAILKMRKLRDQGFSFWMIAKVLNTMEMPTKNRKGRWHARTIQAICFFKEEFKVRVAVVMIYQVRCL